VTPAAGEEFCPGAGITTAEVELIARARFAGAIANAQARLTELEQAVIPAFEGADVPAGERHGRGPALTAADVAGFDRVLAAAGLKARRERDAITYEECLASTAGGTRRRAAEGHGDDNRILAGLARDRLAELAATNHAGAVAGEGRC
jgi:hypothetical protein